ncbi:15531_t:CDS:2, partial [Dentiscutata erythropus]
SINSGQKSSIKEHASYNQHRDALRLEATNKTADETLIRIMKYIQITYKNETYECEFAFTISNTIKSEI